MHTLFDICLDMCYMKMWTPLCCSKMFFLGVVKYGWSFDLKIHFAEAKTWVEKVKSGGKSCLNVRNTNKSHFQRHCSALST